MGKVKTLQIGNRLLILDGKGPMRWFNLKTNKLHIYKAKKPFKQTIKLTKEKS